MTDPITDPCSCSQAGATHQRFDEDFCRGGAVDRDFQCCEPDLTLNSAVGPQDNINTSDPHSGMPETVASLHGATTGEETATGDGRPDPSDAAGWLRAQLWPSLGRPEGGGLDMELIDAVADMADHRDQLQADLARVTQERNDCRQVLEEVRRQRDNANTRIELARGALLADGYFTDDQVGDDTAPRIIERVAALNDEVDTEREGRFVAEEDQRVTRRELDQYYLAPVFAERDEARAEATRFRTERDKARAALRQGFVAGIHRALGDDT